MINHLGTFDVQNYGDLLYPVVFQHLLRKRVERAEVRRYALLPGKAPLEAGFETSAARSLFDEGQVESRTLVIGGGDILRTDWAVVARHYGRTSRGSYGDLRRSLGESGRLGYLLRKKVPVLDADRFYAQRFRMRWMNYPAVGPFLINPEDLPKGGLISYISCGVPHDFEAAEQERVKRTFDQARTIYLRDEQSAEKLRRAGVRRAIHVAPDLTVTLSDQFNHADQAKRGREILGRLGIENDRLILCFQSQPYPGFSAAEILRELKHYIKRTGSAVVLLPTGYCHGDHDFLQSLASQSGGTLKYAGVSSIFDMIAVIAASNVFVGTSLHGNITAFSFGIPHLFGPLPVAKSEGFLSAANLPPELKLGAWCEINERIDMVQGLGRKFFAQQAREAKAKVYIVVAEVLQYLLK